MKKILLSLVVLLIAFNSSATHIVGGEIQYEHLGGASYKLTVKLYRDCDPASFDFPSSTDVFVDNGDGTAFTIFSLPILGRDTLNPPIDTCAFDPGICVEQAIYSSIVNLPPNAGGYHLYYQICCRNGSIDNITNPDSARETFYAYIPDNNLILTNSSPIISNFPPVFVCNGTDLSLDFVASDLDGDSLVYSFYTPYDGIDGTGITYSAATPPNNFQSTTVNWDAGYSVNSPLDPFGGPGLSIDPNTGFISGSPVMVGQFVVGVMVDEYRDGVLIGRITRDFQMNVLNCPPPQEALIGPANGCVGSSITFDNQSGAGANGFFWDFDTNTPNINPLDTSEVTNPTHLYPPGVGTYDVMLIAQKGTTCADTAYYTLNLSSITPNFTIPATVCVNEVFSLTDGSLADVGATINQWFWDFGDGSTSTLQNPTHFFTTSGSKDIKLIVYSDKGCIDSLIQSIVVVAPPQANITPLIGCNGLTVDYTSASDLGASGFWWTFGTGFPADEAFTEDASFTYSTYGSYTAQLVTQFGTACADTTTYDIVLTELIPDIEDLDTICVNSLVTFEDLSTVSNGTITNWAWDFGDAGNSTAQNPTHGYSASGDYDVQVIVTSSIGCVDSITKVQVVKIAPVSQIGPIDACSGLDITFDNFSNPLASDFWWGFGTGNPADSSIVYEPSFTFPSYGTFNITLIAQKGTGCQTTDTYLLNISELTADFEMVDTACVNSIVTLTDQSISAATLTLWEWDFDDSTPISLNQNESHSYLTGGTYLIELVVGSSVGCSDTLVKTLFIQDNPLANAGLDTALCVASPSLTLDGLVGSATGGLWSNGNGVFNLSPSQLNATYNPSLAEINAGQIELYLTTIGNGYCPEDKDTIVITYLADPIVDAGLDISICSDSAYVNISATSQNTFSTSWSSTTGTGAFGDVAQETTTYTPNASDVALGFISLNITTSNNSGCPNTEDSLYIFFNTAPTVNVVSDDTSCTGYEVLLESNSSTGNGWWESLGDGTFSPSDTGVSTYYTSGPSDLAIDSVIIVFHTLDNGGCYTLFDTTTIKIIPSPIVNFTSNIPCLGSPSVFTDGSTSIEPIIEWAWEFETGQTASIQNPTHSYGNYGAHPVQLIVTSLNGCVDTLNQDAFTYDTPIVNFTSPEPCKYGAVFLSSSTVNDTSIVSWIWNFGEGTTSAKENPIHSFDTEGIYDISLTVESFFGCSNSITISTEIFPKPFAAYSVTPNPGEVFEDIVFTDESTSSNSTINEWIWDFQNGDTSIFQNPIMSYEDAGHFDIMLIVFDANGCRDTVIHGLDIIYGPDVPSAFSPNGDGNNDFAMVLGGEFQDINFKIYNNWGEVIFETSDLNALGWDGTYLDIDQPIGVYIYTAIVTTANGVVVKISGDISLIR